MRSLEIKWAYPAFVPDEPVGTYLLARVQKSNNPSFRVNDLVHGLLPLQEYTSVSAKTTERLEVIHNPRGLEENLFLGALGMPGLTAYSSVCAIGKPKQGETIFISSAAGAVGQIVGQLAKHEGLTVIGSVGSYEKLSSLSTILVLMVASIIRARLRRRHCRDLHPRAWTSIMIMWVGNSLRLRC
jgi:NADPH-dependent curcumin reductase CurA